MKRLNHILLRNGVDITKLNYGHHYIRYDDCCKFCGKSASFLYNELQKIQQEKFSSLHMHNDIISCIKIYDKYYPCLTEDEYIIKSIIE